LYNDILLTSLAKIVSVLDCRISWERLYNGSDKLNELPSI